MNYLILFVTLWGITACQPSPPNPLDKLDTDTVVNILSATAHTAGQQLALPWQQHRDVFLQCHEQQLSTQTCKRVYATMITLIQTKLPTLQNLQPHHLRDPNLWQTIAKPYEAELRFFHLGFGG